MYKTVADLMHKEVKVVDPEETLIALERAFLDAKVSGFPVVDKQGQLVGIVSRSDMVRQLGVEQELAEYVSDYYRELHHFDDKPEDSLQDIAVQVGERIEHLRIRDVMIRRVITVVPETSLQELARTFIRHHIHRVPVTTDNRLVGIVTAFDLVRLFAEQSVTFET